jgi:hypothetical protein
MATDVIGTVFITGNRKKEAFVTGCTPEQTSVIDDIGDSVKSRRIVALDDMEGRRPLALNATVHMEPGRRSRATADIDERVGGRQEPSSSRMTRQYGTQIHVIRGVDEELEVTETDSIVDRVKSDIP